VAADQAVKDGRVFVNPSGVYLWTGIAPRRRCKCCGLRRLFIRPEFADLDVGKETRNFYEKYFHYALSDDELNSILHAAPP